MTKNETINKLQLLDTTVLQKKLMQDSYYLYNNFLFNQIKNKDFWSEYQLYDILLFLKEQNIKLMPFRYGYKGLLELTAKIHNYNDIQNIYNNCFDIGVFNYAQQNNISNYFNIEALFYLCGFNVQKMLNNNLNKARQSNRKLSEQQIIMLKDDLENNEYQSYSQISRKYHIRIDSLHGYIKKYNIHVKYIASEYKKSSRHLADNYEKWVQKINKNGIKEWIYDQLINCKTPLDKIYQLLLKNKKGYSLDQYDQKYCPVAYYVNLHFKEYSTLPGEKWKDYHDSLIDKIYTTFKVSNYGRILTQTIERNQKHIIVGGIQNNGYLNIHIRYKNKNGYYNVHQLVAKCFINNPQNKPYVDHINTITHDNRVSNLRWVTSQENSNNYISKIKNAKGMKKNWQKGTFNKTNLKPCVAINATQQITYYFISVKSLQDFFDYHSHTLKERWFGKGFIESKRHKLHGWSLNSVSYDEYMNHRYLDPTLK